MMWLMTPQQPEPTPQPKVELENIPKGIKPMGHPAYGKIGHLKDSRLGEGDHRVSDGENALCTFKRDRSRCVWIQTKLDGSCVAVWMTPEGEILALTRAGYHARTSPYEQHHLWADWAEANARRFKAVLQPGERLVGEWLAQAHGTKYDLRNREPFVAFDLMHGAKRTPFLDFEQRVGGNFFLPDVWMGPETPEKALKLLDSYGADEPEGVVYRVEYAPTAKSPAKVNFLAKFVRRDKVDGKYLKGEEEIWNWRP